MEIPEITIDDARTFYMNRRPTDPKAWCGEPSHCILAHIFTATIPGATHIIVIPTESEDGRHSPFVEVITPETADQRFLTDDEIEMATTFDEMGDPSTAPTNDQIVAMLDDLLQARGRE